MKCESRRLSSHGGLPCTPLDAHRKVSIDAVIFRLIYGTRGELRTNTFETMLDMLILDMWDMQELTENSLKTHSEFILDPLRIQPGIQSEVGQNSSEFSQ